MGFEFIGEADGATHFGSRHVTANVDVAKLGDAQAIELLRQSADRQIDLMHAIIVPADEKAVSAYSEGNRSGERGGGLYESAAVQANFIGLSA
jgi:hypothetical protein